MSGLENLGITREEVLDLAATKLADSYADDSSLSESVDTMLRERVKELIENGVRNRIDSFLDAEMKRIVAEEIVPVNIWGEREGKPTTIRAELAKRAKEFWNVRVDDSGRESSYGGEERSKRLMKEVLKDEFAKAIKENAELIIGEFKAALKVDATRLVSEHIDRLINVKERR